MGKTSKQVPVKFTDEQLQIIDALVGPMGGTRADVVRGIVISWLSEKSIMSNLIKEKWLKKEGTKQ